MSTRAFAIPTLQALALVTTQTACGDLMLGSWDGTSMESYGTTIELPYHLNYGYYYYGGDAGRDITTQFSMTRESEGEFEIITHYFGYGRDEQYSITYALTGERRAKGVWTVEIPDFTDISLDCVAERDAMTCEGERGGEPLKLGFERGEDLTY